MSEAPAPERTALYRLYDAKGLLLYAGISNDPKRRWSQHAKEYADAWWPLVSRREVEWFESRSEAEAAELRAIREEGPVYNVADVMPPTMLEPGWRRRDPSERTAERQVNLWLYLESRRTGVPLPKLVAEELRKAIKDGVYRSGEKLPTGMELRHRFGVSNHAVTKGVAILREEGLVETRGKKGHFVS